MDDSELIIQVPRDDERKLDGLCKSPAKALSVEMITEIFSHCLPIYDLSNSSTYHDSLSKPSAIPSTLEAPLLLGRICRFWRQVVYSTPALWTNLVFDTPNDLDYEETGITQKTFKAIEKWLFFSKSLPISITLYGDTSWIQGINVTKILKMLIPHSKRWRSVRFYSLELTRSALEILFKEISDNMPILETLDFSFVYPAEDGTMIGRIVKRVPIDFSSSVALKTLVMFSKVWESIDVVTPLEHLNLLRFRDSITKSEFFRLLRSFPFLDTLDALLSLRYEENVQDSYSEENTILTHANLKTLRLQSFLGITELLDSLKLPFLQNFTLVYRRSSFSPMAFLPTQLLIQSGCNLRKLVIHAQDYKIDFEEELLPFLRLTPALEELEANTEMDDVTFRRLTLYQGQASIENICPNLQVLKLRVFYPVPYALLQVMVKSRYENQQNLYRTTEDRNSTSGISITFYGYMYDLVDFPDVWQCFRQHQVQCANRISDIPLPVDAYLSQLSKGNTDP